MLVFVNDSLIICNRNNLLYSNNKFTVCPISTFKIFHRSYGFNYIENTTLYYFLKAFDEVRFYKNMILI